MIRLHKINVKKVIIIFFKKINDILLHINNTIIKLINNKIYNKIYYINGNSNIKLYIIKLYNIFDDIKFYNIRYPIYSDYINNNIKLLKPKIKSIEIKYYNYLTDLFLYKLNNYVVETLDILNNKFIEFIEFIDFDQQENLYYDFDIFLKNVIKFKTNINKYITSEKYDHIQLSYFVINNLIKNYIPVYLKSMEFYKYYNQLNYKLLNNMYKLNNRHGYKSILNLF